MSHTLLRRVPALPIDRPFARLGLIGFVAMAGSQIAIPLAEDRDVLTVVVIAGFAVASFGFAADAWGSGPALRVLTLVLGSTWALERIGSTTGFPFGDYEYTGALEPELGGVPLVVPLAWFAMGIPALEIGRRLSPTTWFSVATAAAALAAWDLLLDPQMVDEGYWAWAVDGAYFGIPLSNYLGWLGAGALVLAAVDRVAPAGRARPSLPLLVLYTWWAVMSSLGLIVFLGLPGPGLIGGLAMGSICALAWHRSMRLANA